MIGFAQIAGGMPSAVSNMTAHLLNNTLGDAKEAAAASYYNRGGEVQSPWYDLAELVIAGDVERADAIDALMGQWSKTWDHGDDAAYFDARAAFEDRFDNLVDRIESGLGSSHLAIVRPDVEAGVMLGLGIRPGMLLDEKEINNLLAGRRADGGLIEDKHYAVERRMPVNPNTGEQKWSTPIGSYDFCPTPDKSVSVAWAFAGQHEQAVIYSAHLEAAREAVAYIADEIGQAKVGKAGQDGYEAGSVAWLEFTHHTSRRVQIVSEDGAAAVKDSGISGDPNLHTHFLIPNAVFCPSGRVGSLFTMGIRGLIFEADAYYHARLGTKLREAGFDAVLDPETGAVRLPVVPDNIRTLFSKRTNGGEDLARKFTSDLGEDWEALSDDQRASRIKAATQSIQQRANGQKDPVADFEDWRKQAIDAGWTPPPSLQLVGPPLRDLAPDERHRTAYEISLPWLSGRFEHESVVPHFDLRRAALRGLVHTGAADLSDVDAVTKIMREEGVLQYGSVTPLVWGQEEGLRHVSVTTGLHETQEKEFVRRMKAAAADLSGSIPTALLKTKIETSGLDFSDAHGRSQRSAIERIGTGGRFGLVLAAAGAGKTTALKPLVAAWKEQGREVYGSSLAWRQADDMVDAGIDRRKVKAFSVLLKGLDRGDFTLTKDSVVAVDEWGLLGTRQGLELLRHQERLGFSIVALGDERQCQAIEAGAIIDLSRRALGAEQVPEILTTKRQQTDREKQIVGLLRVGRAAEALAMKRSDGTAEMAYGGREGVIARVAALYAERLQASGTAPTISAPTNADAHQISAAVRAERRNLGMVGPDLATVRATDGDRDYSLPLAAGDRVRLFKSTGAAYEGGGGGSIGRNGSVLEVIGANHGGVTLRSKTGRVGFVEWDALRNDSGRIHLSYGDAMTIHTAQGSTAQEHIFALPSGSQAVTGHTGYSAATRHKSVAYLVTSEAAERVAVKESRPINDTHDITLDDKWANVAKALSYQPQRDSATAMLERVRQVKRGAVAAFHSVMQPADPRLRPRAKPAPDVVHRRRWDVAMDALRQVAQAVTETQKVRSRRI